MKLLKIVFLFISIAFVSNIYAQTVYTTKTGGKYHKDSCRYLKYSKKETTIDKAKALGFEACSVCKPTKANTPKSNLTSSRTSQSKNNVNVSKKSVATQCTGKTKSGSRCKRKTKSANGKCHQH